MITYSMYMQMITYSMYVHTCIVKCVYSTLTCIRVGCINWNKHDVCIFNAVNVIQSFNR